MRLKLFKKFFFTTSFIIFFSLSVMMLILSFVLNNYIAKSKKETLIECCEEIVEYIDGFPDTEKIDSGDFADIVESIAGVSHTDIFITDNNGKILICGCTDWQEKGSCDHSNNHILDKDLEKTIKESINYAPETYEVEIDGQRTVHKAFVIACGNASQYGNNAYIAPRASLNDGLLDVTIIEPFNMREAPSLSFQLFNKTIDQDSHVKTLKCNSLHIKRAKDGVAHFDGDPIMLGESIDVKIVKQGLKVIIPSPKNSSGVLTRAQDYLDEIDAFIEQVSRHNKVILNKGKKQVKKILSQ